MKIRFLSSLSFIICKLRWKNTDWITMKTKSLIKEFSRYILVGGSAFLVDFGLLYIFKTFIFASLGQTGLYISTAIGFAGGLVYNYILSLVFVFESAKTDSKGRSVGAFIVFAIIGIIGLLLTELGMYAGTEFLRANYLIVKVFVAAIVLIWNYGARKILIFK